MKTALKLLFIMVVLISCTQQNGLEKMNNIAEQFVKLTLKVGLYDEAVVDAYHGPEEWKPAEITDSAKAAYPKDEFLSSVDNLKSKLNSIKEDNLTNELKIRKRFLLKHLIALETKIKIIGNKKFKFDEESQLLYDAVAPHYSQEHFADVLNELDRLLPGQGDVAERFNKFRNQFIIKPELLDTVFTTAINEARKRTLKNIPLPPNENFVVGYVTGKPWGAYNWYKGNSFSLIEVNTDLPVYIDRAIDLACHEGYPGHHVYNTLLEENLLKKKGWVEFYIYPLFSPTSLIAEGSANFGIEVAFPGAERLKFEKSVLFPLAKLDSSKAELYYKALELYNKLNFARNEAARKYYDGKFSKDELKAWLVKYCLYTPERADKSIDFIDFYGSYVINYNYGLELCRNYINRNGGTSDNSAKRWHLFKQLISEPHTASDLVE